MCVCVCVCVCVWVGGAQSHLKDEPKWKLALKSVALLGSGVAAVRNIIF